MVSTRGFLRLAVVGAALTAAISSLCPAAQAEDGFPFGFEMTLDALPQPGSKRIPTLEIGDHGEAKLDLWCKSGTGQFSVAGNTVIFVAGNCKTATARRRGRKRTMTWSRRSARPPPGSGGAIWCPLSGQAFADDTNCPHQHD